MQRCHRSGRVPTVQGSTGPTGRKAVYASITVAKTFLPYSSVFSHGSFACLPAFSRPERPFLAFFCVHFQLPPNRVISAFPQLSQHGQHSAHTSRRHSDMVPSLACRQLSHTLTQNSPLPQPFPFLRQPEPRFRIVLHSSHSPLQHAACRPVVHNQAPPRIQQFPKKENRVKLSTINAASIRAPYRRVIVLPDRRAVLHVDQEALMSITCVFNSALLPKVIQQLIPDLEYLTKRSICQHL